MGDFGMIVPILVMSNFVTLFFLIKTARSVAHWKDQCNHWRVCAKTLENAANEHTRQASRYAKQVIEIMR